MSQLNSEERGHGKKLSLSVLALALLLPVPLWLLWTPEQALSALVGGLMVTAIFMAIRKIIDILLFQKKYFFFIILFFAKLGLVALFVFVTLHVFGLSPVGLAVGFSVMPLAVLGYGLYYISTTKLTD